VGAGLHQPATVREAVEGGWPQGGVADILEDHVNPTSLAKAHDFLFQVVPSVVNARVCPQREGSLQPVMRTSAGDDVGANGPGHLHQATAQAAGRTHHQDPIAFLQPSQGGFAEREREVSSYQRRLGEGEAIRNRHAVASGDA
jgi:hypothetical protein